ncbi:MAG: hydroxyacid dehydrogenase, partial [Verrucomicrobiae bacterium]|nr:hydroxyacid dehydrogenase [Verrucomicrobiae bacterium]
MDVFFYEAFAEEEAELRALLPAHIHAGFTRDTIQETGHRQPPAPLISIRTQSIIPPDWPLAGIVSRTTGYDHLIGLRVPCGYLPRYCARAVAEQAIMLMLALLRKLPAQIRQFDRFDRDGLTGTECAGKNLLVVGAGNIGSEVVTIARALDMHVRRVDILPERADVSLDEGLPWADAIICAMNLTPHNRGYFRYDVLRRARRGVVLVNIARGEFTPLTDLVRLLNERHLGGVALDVFEDEPHLATALRRGEPVLTELRRHPNVILTPHNSFNTREALQRKAAQTIEQAL